MMQEIVALSDDGTPTTTSLAIAEGVGRQHKNVLELIRKNESYISRFGRVAFETRPFETPGGTQNQEAAILNERQATLLLTYMRNNPVVREFKWRLVDAFYEQARQIKQGTGDLSRRDILTMALEAEKERERLAQQNHQLEQRIEIDAPRVRFAQQVETAPDLLSVTEAAKLIGTGQRRFFSYLRANGWVTRRNEPYQAKINSGHLDVKLNQWKHPDGDLRESITTMVTGKGLAKLQELWADHVGQRQTEDMVG